MGSWFYVLVASLWSFVLVAYGLMFWWLAGPGQLLVGSSHIAEEAHLSGIGNTIRMVVGHFIELARCPAAKAVAFRKARL